MQKCLDIILFSSALLTSTAMSAGGGVLTNLPSECNRETGTAEAIPAAELTYRRIYGQAFKGPPDLGYLAVSGFVKPAGFGEK